jgi:hypothetical protein
MILSGIGGRIMSDVQENLFEKALGWAKANWTLPLWLIAIILLLASTVVDLSISYELEELRKALPKFLFTKLATHVTRDVGLSMLIGLFVSSVIERRHQKELKDSLNSRIQSISENVFSGVYNSDIPKAIVSEAIEQILKARIVRSELDINYTIKAMSVTLTNDRRVTIHC